MKISIGKNVYEGNRIYADNCLKVAREKCEKLNMNIIYAIEKDDVLNMTYEVHTYNTQLLEAVNKYELKGFKCYYVTRREIPNECNNIHRRFSK